MIIIVYNKEEFIPPSYLGDDDLEESFDKTKNRAFVCDTKKRSSPIFINDNVTRYNYR